jgi:hypothetical protein
VRGKHLHYLGCVAAVEPVLDSTESCVELVPPSWWLWGRASPWSRAAAALVEVPLHSIGPTLGKGSQQSGY